jgi:hypothetical protein
MGDRDRLALARWNAAADSGRLPRSLGALHEAHALSGLPSSCIGVCSPPPDSRGHWSGRGAAWLAHQTGGLGVAGSNPVAPTTLYLHRVLTHRTRIQIKAES